MQISIKIQVQDEQETNLIIPNKINLQAAIR